jgi:hypothetical protein
MIAVYKILLVFVHYIDIFLITLVGSQGHQR